MNIFGSIIFIKYLFLLIIIMYDIIYYILYPHIKLLVINYNELINSS